MARQSMVAEGEVAGQAMPRSASELFMTYAGIALQSFGGALAITERTLVRKKRWLSAQDLWACTASARCCRWRWN